MRAPTTFKSAASFIALVADPGSFEPWDEDVVARDPLSFSDRRPYPERLAAAREATGTSEAAQAGRATLNGRPIAIIASEFGFIGGSIGTATGERIARAFDRAQEAELPVVALTSSGGTRMQEGSLALVQMAKLAAAARQLRSAGLPYVVCCGHPTTGGVMASWASLGTVTFALPGALLGFGGPRVVELLTGRSLPDGIQRAENLLAHGLIDDVVEPDVLRERVARVLAVAAAEPPSVPSSGAPSIPAQEPRVGAMDAWRSLQLARDRSRPGARNWLGVCATNVTVLRGDRTGGDDPGCLVALARLRGIPVLVIAQARDDAGAPSQMTATGYRKAQRGLDIADELDLPVVTVIDTPGAEMSVAAEESGLSIAIAQMLAEMSRVTVPTVSVLLGEGGSGGALALLPADRVVCAEHASLTPIAPEGASAILYRTTAQAPELAATQAIASSELLRHGIADRVVFERPATAEEGNAFLLHLGDVVASELRDLLAQARDRRLRDREQRYRTIGEPSRVGST